MKVLVRAVVALSMVATLLGLQVQQSSPAFAEPTEEEVTGGGEISGNTERETDAGSATKPLGGDSGRVRDSNPPDCSDSKTVWFWEASRSNTKQVEINCMANLGYPNFGPITTGMSVEYTSQYGIWPGMRQCPNPMPQDGYNPPFGSTWTIGVKVNVNAWWERTGAYVVIDNPGRPADPGTPDLDPEDPNYRPPDPGVPPTYGTEYTYTPQVRESMTCYEYTAPDGPRTARCAQASNTQIMGPYDTFGDPMVPKDEGGTLTRQPNGPGTGYSVEGPVTRQTSRLGDAIIKAGGNPRSRAATKEEAELNCLAAGPLSLDAPFGEEVSDYGRYYTPQTIYYTNASFIEFKSWGTNNTVLSKIWPKYYEQDGWFQTGDYYPHFVESTNLSTEKVEHYYSLRCQWVDEGGTKVKKEYFVQNIETGAGWRGANWSRWERLGDQTYQDCTEDPLIPVDTDCDSTSGPCVPSDKSRERDIMRCAPSTGAEFIVNGKRAAPIEYADPDRFNSNGVFEANATGTPYGIRWEEPKVVLNANGKDVTTLPGADPVWRVKYQLTPSSSPILIKNPITGRDVDDPNDRNQPYNIWANRDPDNMNNPPTPSTQWFPLSWSGNPMSVPVDEWSEREDDGWQNETRALWLKFFQSTTAGRYGWQLTPNWEITANVPITGEVPIFQDYTARGYWKPKFGGLSTEIRRVSYTCTGQRLNANVTRSVDLFR